MPTIDDLPAASAAADSDELALSQGGVARKATRAQVVAGLQPALGLGQGQLLGRASSGQGAPEAIGLGANLSLQGNLLQAATEPLDIPALAAGAVPSAADLVPLGQGGRNVSVSYAQFLAGISAAGGVDLSGGAVTASGAPVGRSLADIAADAVPVEAFGAKGDGISDDTAALAAAVASGLPVRLGAKTYMVNGQFTIATAGTTLLGVAGRTVLRRGAQAGNGAWIAIQADGFRAEGVIFDANGAAVQVESWGVFVSSACLHSDFHRCEFRNAYGASLGSGLVFQASDPAVCEHAVRACAFSGNAAHGVWVQAVDGVLVAQCDAYGNGQYGIAVDFNDATFARKARLCRVVSNRAWGNQRGISAGNYNATNTQPATWGNANPDAVSVLVAGNVCHDNAIYGIAVAGQYLAVLGNVLSNNGTAANGGAGILANAASTLLGQNMVSGAATYGIDCGGSLQLDVRGNQVSGGTYGINCGGGQFVRVSGNTVTGATVASVCVANVETDGSGNNFGIASSGTAIEGNWIGVDGAAAGVWLRDGPQAVSVRGNHFAGGGSAGNCLWADTDGVIVEGNRFNFQSRFVCNPAAGPAGQQIVFPDIADSVMVTQASAPVQAMLSSRQAQTAGTIAFVRITAGGSGYTHAALSFGGSGTGAVATAFVSNGAVIGALVTAAGSGFGAAGTQVPVTITGDGAGAAAVAYAGPPLPEERRLRVRCDCAVGFAASGSAPAQQNWTGAAIAMPAGSDIDWTVTWGAWRAGVFPAANLLGSTLRLVANGEAAGCTSAVGRGSPEGVVSAPPGSDWRNLDGGAGSTWWVKQSGTGPTGWAAIA